VAVVEVKKILCPTDFSAQSEYALDLALGLARWYEAEVKVLHATPHVPPKHFPYLQEPLVFDEETRERALEELGKLVERSRTTGVEVAVGLADGDTVAAILQDVQQLPADLLVIGTHGRGGFERFMLGSVAEKVLRKASCPVLIVPPAAAGPSPERPLFKRILCPLDFGPSSTKALELALSLAEEADAHLTLLNVLEFVPQVDPSEGLHRAIADYRSRQEEEARARLRGAIPEDARDWCEPEEVVTYGRAYQEILKLAEEQEAELIVMGVQGRSAFDLALFGSTAQQVVRNAPCPVLVVRSGPDR
jgi:nucleotide-binding universal stress UspA family protein